MVTDALKAVLSPVELGGLTLRNRVFVPGHTTNFGSGNRPTTRHVDYHAERARGGVGLIITEAVRVHPTSAGRHSSLGSFDDESIPAYAAVAEAVHAEGAALFAQIMHAGRQANGDATRTAAWSSSALPWTRGAHVPHVMSRSDIDTVIAAFGAAAGRMRRAGYDGLEIHAGHGHLLQQFLSPATNHRRDGYGGDLDNRLRLTRQVLTSVRGAAPDLPVGLRVSADEFLPGGLEPADVIEIVDRLRAEFPLSFVHVSHSAYQGSWSLATQMADMSFDHAPFRHHPAEFRRALPGLPVLAVCRLDSLPEAAELVTAGEADLVGLARPHIADPYLVRKAAEGRQDSTRSCLACNQGCIGRVESNLPISCVVNPEVGAERVWSGVWRRPRTPAPVVVVGGGPAGLEAALSARRRGHRVTLLESESELGGQIRLASRLPGRRRLELLVTELERDVRAAGVDVRTGVHADPEVVAAIDPAEVIIATGSTPSRRALPDGPPVVDLRQALEISIAQEPVPDVVVVLDDTGSWAAASVAEQFAVRGARVHLVSSTPNLCGQITTYSKLALTKRFADHGVHIHLLREARGAGPDSVALVDVIAGAEERVSGVGAVVDAGPPAAEDALFRDVEAWTTEGPRVHLVGDANAPRTALEAIYEGRIAGSVLAAEGAADPVLLELSSQ